MSSLAPQTGLPTDESLFERLRAGDEAAFLALYRRRQGGIYRFALHMSGSAVLAEDITQEVFLALIRADSGYDPRRGALSGYLFGIARKLVLRHIERTRADVALAPDSDDSALSEISVTDDPMVDLTRRESIDALRHAIVTLPRRYREVVVLCDLDEVDYAAAARILECPVGTVRSRLHRARALLLHKLLHNERGSRLAVGALKPARCAI